MNSGPSQHLYLVFGGELKHVGSVEFADPSQLHVVGLFPDAGDARRAWSAAARATIDDPHMRYFMIDVGNRLEPPHDG